MTAAHRIGIDVGGTKCLGVVVADGIDDAEDILAEAREPTPYDDDELIEVLAAHRHRVDGDRG